jgi:non-canonical (house-cleaning) NTP pyrophosphatase
MNIYLGTESKLKIQAVQSIIDQFIDKKLITSQIELIGKETESKVPLTPFNEQALHGAQNRAISLFEEFKEKGEIFVGLESALVERYTYLFEECWCYILDKNKKEYIGYSSGYYLPEIVSQHVKKGGKHIDIMKELEQKYKISGKDTWGIYTKNIISRNVSIEEAFRNAFSSLLIKH